jgi:ATP-dependent Lon protease
MSDKVITSNSVKKENTAKQTDIELILEKKTEFFKNVVQKTILYIQKNKMLDILGISDVSTCIDKLNEISKKINEIIELTQIKDQNAAADNKINGLQFINNELSGLFKNYGTQSLDDLLVVCFGNNYKITTDDEEQEKFELIKKYFHPTSYKVVVKKDDKDKKPANDSDDKTKNLDCSDITGNYKQLHMKVYGMKLYINNTVLKKSLIIYGTVDDIIVDFLNNSYISRKQKNILTSLPNDDMFNDTTFKIFMSSLILKDYLIYDNHVEIYNKFAGILTMNAAIHQKQISHVVKEFITDDIYSKRNTIISLLIKSSCYDNQYLAYLLYDILSNDSNGNVDTQEQTTLFDSFPWSIKQCFKQAMKKTIQYTNELSNFDINKIPLEQQICLLKANDNVKEKAMMKLKEVKAKSEDSGSKARQYLDGLLKIPFSVYKREPVLHIMNTIRTQFNDMYKKYTVDKLFPEIPCKEKYTSIEILKHIKTIQNSANSNGVTETSEKIEKIKKYLISGDKKKIIANIKILDSIKKKHNKPRFKYSHLTKDEMCVFINEFLQDETATHSSILNDIVTEFEPVLNKTQPLNNTNLNKDITNLVNNMKQITDYICNVKNTLDKAVHGHDKAKKQIERIIGQWINGEQKGACFGFEGNPGIGKTTLAKGLADCLKDEHGISRPFALIALGGDSNASTLVGHSYTYVGSTWSQIIQILMDKKCMNPIIVFDEVDKISKTEHGKEITGILTHLLDPTQNDSFQDKYFSGIDIDLSKVLFILSYNDVDSIDKVLLDRVHRIKFDSLSIEDKVVICNNHLLPEIYKKVGLEDAIYFSDETIKFIVEEYTLEPGVRKLKEKLFEIVGEINLNLLKEYNTNTNENIALPIVISKEDIINKYFKDKPKTKIHKIHSESKVGLINALWANSHGSGGVLPLQCSFIPSNKFLDLVLTGSMGDVMKESISVSLTNAWNLTSAERQKYLIEKYNDTKTNNVCGIHIHCPDISTKKDGPSATTAFTVLIYSLFNDIKIKHNFGITGETHFGYQLTEIGGLQEKIIHSIKAGITEFIYPKENDKDFDKIMEKYKNNEIVKGIKFHSINHINEVFDLILEK